MTAAELAQHAERLGIDVIGAAAAAPYEETERHIRERRIRGLFGDMRFTMSRPETSCHPETLLANARTVVSAALCYYTPGPEPGAGEGRLPRYAWSDHYALLRAKLDALGRRLGGSYRVLVDANHHVDRAGAARSGVGFYGKNTLLITRAYGSCRLCVDGWPTGALDEPGILDSTKCLAYWTQAPKPIPEPYREGLGAQVYGCDICQEVCPWNRGIEKRRASDDSPAGAEPVVSLVDWLEADRRHLMQRYHHLPL